MDQQAKKLTVKQKLTMMAGLYHFAFKIKKFQLLQKYPHLSEMEIDRKVSEMIQNGCK